MNFILTQIGSKKADYIVECIRQLHFFNNTNIYLVSNNYHKQLLIKKNLLKKIIFINEDQIKKNNKHNIFLKNTKLDGKFYNQFWIKTVERFFFIENLCSSLKLKNILHIENDNLVYYNFENFLNKMKKFKILFNPLNNNACMPNVLYFRSYNQVKIFVDFIYENNKYFFLRNNLNDQELCFKFFNTYKSKSIANFPIISKKMEVKKQFKKEKFYKNFEIFKGIFDSAPIGQYLDGVDSKIHKLKGPFLNENSIYETKKLNVKFLKTKKIKKPYIILNNKEKIPIINLHLHSKNLRKFISY
jgi:hypothetical protein